jgi:hypothetical protein
VKTSGSFELNRSTCPKCLGFVYENKKCSHSLYHYRFEGTSDPNDWQTGYFRGDAEDVALEAAEGDYYVNKGGDPHQYQAVVIVKDPKGKETRFRIYAEATVNFYADEIGEKK